MKQRNKVVLTSMASIAMCASMIAGGTYALFTSESEVNVAVTSGTVKVEATAKGLDTEDLYMGEASLESGYVSINNMIPGDSVTFNVEVTNYSTVTANYRTIVKTTEDTGLASALTVSFAKADGTEIAFLGGYGVDSWEQIVAAKEGGEVIDTITVTIAFNSQGDEKDNQYNGDYGCKYQVLVEAVQGNATVVDPITKIDENNYEVNNEEGMQLMTAIANATPLGIDRFLNFALTNDLDMTGYEYVPTNRYFINFDGGNHTIANLTAGADEAGHSALFGNSVNVKNVTLKNMTVSGGQAALIVGYADSNTISNVTIAGDNTVNYVDGYTTWGGVGAFTAINYATMTDITLEKDATITLNYNGMLTKSTYQADSFGGHFMRAVADSSVTDKGATIKTTGEWGHVLADGLALMSDGTYKIMNANGLVYANENYFAKGGTFKLENSVDMTGIAWTPVNVGAEFAFDGGNNTIANLTVDTVGSVDGMGAVGFVLGYSRSGNISISDVTFDGAKIVGDGKGNTNGAVVLASSHRHSANTVVMKNVTVQNSTVEACDRSGGLLGYVDSKSTVTLTDCKVNGNVIESVGTAGALLAYPQGVSVTINGFEAKNNTISSSEGSNKAGIAIGTIASPITVTVDDLDAALAGSTAINAREATDNFAGRYVSGSLTVNGNTYVANDAQLSTVLGTSETKISIMLGNGTYNNFKWGISNVKNVTVTGTKKAIVSAEGNDQHPLGGSTVTFNGITVKGGASDYNGFTHYAKATYNDCVIVNQNYLYGETYFNDCTFELAAGCYIYTYGASVVKVDTCEFNTAGKALIMYKDGNITATLTVKNSVFNASEAGYAGTIDNQACAAIEIDNYGSSAYTLITENNTVDSDFSGEWRIKRILDDTVIAVNGAEYSKTNGDVFLDGVAYTLANEQVSKVTA